MIWKLCPSASNFLMDENVRQAFTPGTSHQAFQQSTGGLARSWSVRNWLEALGGARLPAWLISTAFSADVATSGLAARRRVAIFHTE